MDAFAHPALLLLGPLAVLLLWLLERWRQRPVRLVVADVGLFEPTPEVEAAARARRRKVTLRFLLLAGAALALGLAAAGPRGPRPAAGPLLVDVVLDRGVASGALERDGASRLEHHRRHLRPALDLLRADDRVRVHLVPGDAGTTPLAPADARALLDAATPTAASSDGDLEAALARVAPQVMARSGALDAAGRAPVLVATDRALALDPAVAPHVHVAISGGARPDRSILALARGDDGALHATLGSHEAAGPARVTFRATSASGEVADTRELLLPARGLARATWPGAPRDALVASATLDAAPPERDALAANDQAFAAAAPPRRRVALIGEPGAAVRRALTAVVGTETVDLPADVFETAPQVVPGFDLVVVTRPLLPLALPRTALVVVTPALPRAGALPGGVVAGRSTPGFEHTLDEVTRGGSSLVVEGLAPLDGFASAAPLLVVGDAPLVAVTGAGRSLVVAITAPLTPEATSFTRHDAFPLFWAELLALAAPRETGELRAHPAGVPWRGPGRALTPLRVELLDDEDGTPLVGTVAAPAPTLAAPAPPQAFPTDLPARLAAGRRPGEPISLAPGLAALALCLLAAAWWPAARRSDPAAIQPAHPASARR